MHERHPSTPQQAAATGSSALALVGAPGVLPTLALSLAARIPLGVAGLLLLLQARALGLSYAVSGAAMGSFTLGMGAGSPLLSRLADRRGHAVVLSVSAVIGSAALLAGGRVPASAPWFVALAGAIGLTQPPIAACVRVAWSRLLERRDQEAIQAVDVACQQVVYIVGPLALVPLATATSPALALQVTGAVLLISASAFARAPATRNADASSAGMRASSAVGAPRAGALAHGAVKTLVQVSAGLGISFGATEVAMIAFSERHGVQGAVGVLYGAWAAGTLLGGLLWAHRTPAGDRVRQSMTLLTASSTMTLLLATVGSPWLLGAMLAVSGALVAPVLAIFYALMGQLAPPHAITEAYGWETTGLTGGIALGSALAGATVGLAGTGAVFLLAGATVLATTALLALRAKTLRGGAAA